MENVEMTPVDMTSATAEPPKANPLGAIRKPPALKLPPKPTLASGLKLPAKPVIRKPGSIAAPKALPKPIVPSVKPSAAPAVKPPSAVPAAAAPAAPVVSKPMEQLKSVTQKLKGITQEIPQQAILHKTGIIGDVDASAAQKEAAKHKTARISLSDAMGVAPVKSENAPMKTIRIKRPIGLASSASAAPAAPDAPAAPAPEESGEATITQRKTLKIARPGGVVRPTGKFALKSSGETPVADAVSETVPDIPDLAVAPRVPVAVKGETDLPQWTWALSLAVQFAACIAIGALAFFLYQNTATLYF